MVELNNVYLHAFVMVNKFFQKHKLNYYPTSIGTAYKEIFKRDTLDVYLFMIHIRFNIIYTSMLLIILILIEWYSLPSLLYLERI